MLGEAEARQLLVEWNVAPAESLGIEVLHQRFAAQAARTPEAVAVVCEGATLTYAELDRRANQIGEDLALAESIAIPLILVLLVLASSMFGAGAQGSTRRR